MKFSNSSLKKLDTCDCDLQNLAKMAIRNSPYDFGISYGHRTPQEQAELYAQGRTKPGNIVTNCDGYVKLSKHNNNPSKAFDIIVYLDGKITWDIDYYIEVGKHIVNTAVHLGIKVSWGGDWKKFKDYPHYEIP